MNNNENNQKRAPESMEELIAGLFAPAPAEEALSEITEGTAEAESSESRTSADREADRDAENGTADTEVSFSDDGKTASKEGEAHTEQEPIPVITEGDSAEAAAVKVVEEIRSEQNERKRSQKKSKDEFDPNDDSWDFLKGGKKRGGNGYFTVFITSLTVFLSILLVFFLWGVNQLADIYEKSAPERLVDGYVEHISGAKIFNDIAQRIVSTKTEFETERSAAENALKSLSFDADKRYFLVSEAENSLLYDIFSGNTHLYSLTLKKSSEWDIFDFTISFWEIGDVEFVDNCISSAAKSYTVSAPIDADVRINGIPVSDSYITNDDYRFFIGSAWESEMPDIARCVLYTVDGLYGPPTVTATLDGEELEVYVDGDGVSYHVKYPKKWVKDYTVSVPKGASVYVNGILATKIHSTGKGEDTLFDSGENAVTDVYLIEGLFEKPTVTASYGTESLGTPIFADDHFSFGYIESMYRTSYVTVPKGAQVKVNGILLTGENSTFKSVPFSEWSQYAITLNNYMPSELKATTSVSLPEFICYTVPALYVEPALEVTLNGAECNQFFEQHGETSGKHMFDYPMGVASSEITAFAKDFAKDYVKYCTEGCYGVNDDIELRKKLYQNWVKYLSYVVPDSLCYDKALESYTDIRFRPIRSVVSEEYDVQNIMKYSDDVYFCRIVCTVRRTGDDQHVISFVNALIVRINGEYMIWSHDTIPA